VVGTAQHQTAFTYPALLLHFIELVCWYIVVSSSLSTGGFITAVVYRCDRYIGVLAMSDQCPC